MGRLLGALPSGEALPDDDWERHHAVVLRVLLAVSLLIPLYASFRGYGALHAAAHVAPVVALALAAYLPLLTRGARGVAGALALMTACAVFVHTSDGATEAHFLFFALLPLAAVYATWPPLLAAVGFVALHHFALGSLLPGSVFGHPGTVLGMATLHAALVLIESLACLVAWRLFEDRRTLVESLAQDRTAELHTEREALARLAAIIESTDDAVFTTTLEGVIVTWNPGAERLYGYSAAEAVGKRITLIVVPERAGHFTQTLRAIHTESQHVENVHLRKDGSRFDALLTISKIYDADGTATGAAAIVRDISERKRNEAAAVATARELEEQARELSRLALHDSLTGLANRALLRDRLEQALARRPGSRVALLVLDLDEFKSINDVYGHPVGDEVLLEVARRLTSCVRSADTVARLGGDEFVILVDDVEDHAAAAQLAGRALGALARPISIAERDFSVGASIGITLSDHPAGRDPTELLRDADIAMYVAKESGKGGFQLFEPDMHDKLIAHTALVRDLRTAVAQGQLRLVYQPQVDLPSGRITGVEALVRWEHPERGLIPPDHFIPTAETTGIIVEIDNWVLSEACGQMRVWDEAGLALRNLAVNVSGRRLVSGDLAETIAAALDESGIDPGRLEVEITETVAVQHEPDAVEAIRRVRALGVRVAIDDFGMGHSALSRLQSFPVDRLKIDRSFIAPLEPGFERGSIADAMIAIGHSLGLAVIAEGVETEEQVRAIRSLGCEAAQGYLFSKPVRAAEIEQLTIAEGALAPLGPGVPLTGQDADEPSPMEGERQIRNLLAELERLTGLDSTYLTHIDWVQAVQRITHSRNTGEIQIPEGLAVDWSDTVCRSALEQGVTYTDDVPSTFPESEAAAALGLQTYVSVPVKNASGDVEGTLCGASTRRITLTPDTLKVMERFAEMITELKPAEPAGV